MRKVLALIVALALVTTACSANPAALASVNGTDITESDVGVLFESATLPIDEGLRQAIFALAAREILVQALEADFGLQVDPAEVETAYAALADQMEQAGIAAADFLGVPDAGEGMVRFNAEIGIIRQTALAGILGQPGILDQIFSDPAQFTTVCVRHVLVGSPEEADQVIARLEGGEDLAAVAEDVSLDGATPGGNLGCSIAARYVTEFANATLEAVPGEVFGPVETEFGFHVMIVDDRSAPSEADVRANPEGTLTGDELNALWQEWFNEKLQGADVTVDEKYGAWTAVGIVPPSSADIVPTEE